MRLLIQSPSPDPSVPNDDSDEPLSNELICKSTSALQIVSVELRELSEDLVSIGRLDASAGVSHFHPQYAHSIHPDLTHTQRPSQIRKRLNDISCTLIITYPCNNTVCIFSGLHLTINSYCHGTVRCGEFNLRITHQRAIRITINCIS